MEREKILKKIIEKGLKILARAVLLRQKPKIVTVTGSIGKTSTKEAIFFVLKEKFHSVCQTPKNYNNEIGVPLTILGETSPKKSLFAWLKIFLKGIFLALFKKKDYPSFLVLEIAADKPGDLKYLMEIIPSQLLERAVLTAVAPVHLEFFKSLEKIFEEKIIPFSFLKKQGIGIVNVDNCNLEKIKKKFPFLKFISYGINNSNVQVKGEEIEIKEKGLAFKILTQNESLSFLLKEGIGDHQIYPLLGAVGVGISFGMNLKEIESGLKNYRILSGRGRKIKGKNNYWIIDDSYNSSPQATKAALKSLKNLPFGKRKIALLGDMLELGKNAFKFHQEIGEKVFQLKIDYLITFGKLGEFIFQGAKKIGMEQNRLFHFSSQEKLINFLKNFLQPGDLILIKASQGMRLERVVREIMLSPQKAPELLVRQDKTWLDNL